MEHTPTSTATPCGTWSHAGWNSSGTVSWTDPEGTPTISNAVERQSWSDPCSNTTQPDQTVSVAYVQDSDVVVPPSPAPNSDGHYHRIVKWHAVCPIGSPLNDLKASDEKMLPYHWASGTGISGGSIKTPSGGSITVAPRASVPVEVNTATDSDTRSWYLNQSDTQPDTISYAWSASVGSLAPDVSEPRKANWTAPSTPGTYMLKANIYRCQKSTGLTKTMLVRYAQEMHW